MNTIMNAIFNQHRIARIIAALMICLTCFAGNAWGATDEVYKTALFGSSYNSEGVQNYTSTWSATNDEFTVNVENGNNNNNGWDLVKFGRKNYASVGTIITAAKVDKAVTKVVLTMSAIASGTTNSVKLYTSSNGSSWSEAGEYTQSSGAQTVTLSSPTANLYYKIEFDCVSASSNGFISVTQVDYYISSGPTLYTVTFDANGGSVTPASATQASAGAAVSLPTPTRSGYNCTGWYTATSGGTKRGDAGGSYTPTESETVHAQWTAKTYHNYRTLCTTTDPTITVSPSSFTDLDYIWKAGPSAAQDITLGGSNLTASVTITAPTNFEVSTDGGSTYAGSKTVSQSAGAPTVTTVKVRMKSGLAVGTYGSASTYVTFESTGATTKNVSVIGHVLEPTITVDPASITSWSTSIDVAPGTRSVTVTGSNLKANISAALTGGDYGSFSISPTSLTQTSGSASGTITISYTGSYAAVTSKSTTLRLTSTDAETVDVPITFNVIVDPNRYELTSFAEIGPKDKVIIVGDNGTKYAMSNNNGTTNPPSAIDVTDYIIEAGAALSIADASTMLWNIVKAGDGSFQIKKQSDNEVWLYCISNNNGLRVGTSAGNDFTIVSDGVANGYIHNTYQGRLVGIYTSSDWRSYGYTPGTSGSVPGNISGQTFSFYVQKSTDPYVMLSSNFSEFTYEYNHGPSDPQSFTVSGANLAANLVVTAPTNYEVCKTSGGTYTSSVSYTPSTGTVSEQTVYIRLVSGLAVGTYNYAQLSGLSVTSTGADAVKAALTGSVTPESFTVTATSSNVSHGTVSPASESTSSSMTITATPTSGYRVISGAGGYTVTTGTASVTNNGDNTFTVTPSTNCTVQINFEAIPTHKVTYWASGVKIQESDVLEGASIPDQTTKTWVQLADYCATRTACVGWCTNPSYTHDTDAPTGMITTHSPGGTMSTSDVNYYAVFANVGGSSNSYSRVTDLSQLANGDVVIIVSGSSNQVILQQTASGVQSGGTRTATTTFTDNTAANHWTLEAGAGDDAGKWRLLKDASNKLTTSMGYTAYGNALTIDNSSSDDFYFIHSGSSYLEYYQSSWKFWSTNNPTANNGTLRTAIYKQDQGYIEYATNCTCPGYSMHFGTRGSSPSDWSDKDSYCFVESTDADGNSGVFWYLEDFELPDKPHYYVGYEGVWNTSSAKSADADFSGLCYGLLRASSCGTQTLGTYSSGNNQGAIGTLRVRSSYTDDNKYIDFIPGGYVLRLSDDNGSNYTSTALVPASENMTETVWTTEDITTVSAALASSGKFYVGLKTSSDYVWASNISEVANTSSMGYKKDGGSSAGSWGTGLSSGMRGKFRIWADNCNKNWNAHFVPYYHLSYDGNGAGATNVPDASDDKSCEGDNSARTVTVSTTVPSRDGYTFTGWNTQSDGEGTDKAANANIVLTADMTLYAQWAQNYTVTYDRVGGTNVCANETCGAGLTYTVCGTEPTKSGYSFNGWSDGVNTYAAGATFTMPSANVTLTAQWTANWRNLTFTIQEGGGSITGGPANNRVLDNHTFTFPNITGKSSEKWCWTFQGWTETAPIASGPNAGTWASAPTIKAAGSTSDAITSDKTYYAVYSKTGAGASGDGSLSNSTIVAKWTGAGNAYGTLTTLSENGTWNYTGFGQSGNSFLQLKDGVAYYLQTPIVGGTITSITINYTAVSSDSRTVYFNTTASKTSAVTHTFDGTYTSGNHDLVVDVSSLDATSIYILVNNTFKINSVSFHFGPPAIYANTLDDCGCLVTQFDLTYDANTSNFPGSTISCSNEDDYVFADHDDEYTFCGAPSALTGYKFLYWAENANGTGSHWEAGETVDCLPSDNMTVYAFYEQVYTVTFNNQGTLTPVTQSSAGAAIDVPSATTPCSAEWAFAGWSGIAIPNKSLAPDIAIASGTSTYTPTRDTTFYAIYRKTSTSDAFEAGATGAYKITNGSTAYAGACNNSKLLETNAAGATVFYIKYTAADGGKYTIQQSDGKYLKYAGSSTSLALDDATPYYWSMTRNGNLWHVLGVGSDRYLQYSSTYECFKAYSGSEGDIAFVAAEGQYYYRTMSCASTFNITYHENGTTINWADGHPVASYKNLADGTAVSTFPTATYSGWTFLGWRSSEYTENTSAPASASICGGSDGTSGNTLTIASADVDLYPVFTRFEDNEQIDLINGGDYYIYFLEEGSDDGYGNEKRVYATNYSDKKRYHSTALCSEATEFTFTKLANGNWTIYDKTTGKYLYGIADDDLKQQAGASGAEWTLTVHSGNEFDAFHVGTEYGQITAFGNGTSATFMNYRRTNIGSNPSYHRVYLGTCTNRTYTTDPVVTPSIDIHGQVKVTSTAGKSVKATSVLTVSAKNISTANLTISSDPSVFKFSLSAGGTYTSILNIPVVSNKVSNTPIYLQYTPTATTDGIEDVTITVTDNAGTPTTKSTEAGDVQGRHLPAEFVIAAKWGDNWYALPADCSTSGSWPGVLIEVDNASDPTEATAAPNTKFGMQMVRLSRRADYGSRLVFTEQLTTADTEEQKTLYNGSTTNIQVYAAYKSYMGENPDRYEWIPSSDDLKDYTLTSADGSNTRPLCLSTSGAFGTYTSGQSYGGNVRLLPATFYEDAPMQVLEWKANSVVVMYTGTETSATTQVGDNSASSSQTLSTRKLTHGVYELATDQALTSNDGKSLTVNFGSTKAIVDIPVIIAGDSIARSGHSTQDVVIVKDGKLTAQSTKYSYKNVYVYGGGKLDIPTGTQLGVNNLILRAGGLTTSGIGTSPSATYDYVYPQVKIAGSWSNTKQTILYEYITDYDHWYHLCLPFNGTLNTITYPQEYYGDIVTASNTGSWVIKRYAGEIRATGENNAWVDIESESATTVTAGHGYIFWAAPKKVTIGGVKDRQKWGVQRITMSTTAAAATTAETADKIVSGLGSYSGVDGNSNRVNDQGWNLIGNPYMANLTELNSTSLKTGKLVEDGQNPGHWVDNEDGIRYVTIPSDHFETYEAQTMSSFTSDNPMLAGRTFFVQIDGDATGVTFLTAKRAAMAPAWQRNVEADQVVDVETGIVMSGAELSDEVDFWIKDGKTEAYESNADYPKTPNQTNFNIYGVHPSGNLSWVAISPSIAETDMAIGYQVPQAGDYILSLSEKFNAGEIESLLVTDHGVTPELTTDLMINSYLFTVHQAETNNERFTVSIKVREQGITDVTTDIGGPITAPGDTPPVKFIYDDKLYILNHGVLYDATGKRVNGTQQVTIK